MSSRSILTIQTAVGKIDTCMSLHKEIYLEAKICEHLTGAGLLYADNDAALYDRARALRMLDLLAWATASKPLS